MIDSVLIQTIRTVQLTHTSSCSLVLDDLAGEWPTGVVVSWFLSWN